jgi:hypothetical protein
MEHLTKEYGLIEIPVRLVTTRSHCSPIQSLADFYAFPEKNGWSVREKDYALNELDELKGAKRLGKADLLQSWIFFGLIFLVIQGEGGPILKFEDLLDDHSNDGESYIDTGSLPEALKQWEKWELAHPETAKVRMVRTELALEYAHRIVRKNCAFDPEESEGVPLPGTGDQDFLSDEVSLSLMVLGETLTAAKARIIHHLGAQMRGWHKDDEGGWGPPRYVLDQMRRSKWCPRTIHLLQGQLGSNATLLLAAFESHKSIEIKDIHQTKGCTKDACMVISEEETNENPRRPGTLTGGTQSSYQPKHESRCPGNCSMVGPKMEEVYRILREQNDGNEDQRFPVLEVKENQDKTLELVVSPWTSARATPFATISHVWSDGLGNENSNEIYYCQLKFISSLLTKVVRSSNSGRESDAKTIPFWMDTLLIPVYTTEPGVPSPDEFKDLKSRAIRQIYHVFHASAHSIVIDRGLLGIDSKGTPWKNVMRILASGWMRRLWTLQEAYLSKQLWITFKQGEETHTGMKNFDDLIGSMINTEALGSSIAEMARLKLFQNIMGYERGGRNHNGDPQASGGAILVANTWRAARWRVS